MMNRELADASTPNLENEVIFGQGYLPLAFVKLINNYKASISVP